MRISIFQFLTILFFLPSFLCGAKVLADEQQILIHKKEIEKNEQDGLRYKKTINFNKTNIVPKQIFVDINSTSTIENGTESNPYKSIKNAVAGANDGDVIIVAQGIYNENEEIYIDKKITLYGNGSLLIGPGIGGYAACFGLGYGSNNVTITNFIIGNWDYSIFIYSTSEGIHQITNNTCVVNDSGIVSFGNCYVADNIIYLNNSFGISYHEGLLINYCNNCYLNEFGDWFNCTPGYGSMSVDPLFAAETELDFHLSSNSPCVDAGFPSHVHNDINGTRNDLGAFGGPFYQCEIHFYSPMYTHFQTEIINLESIATVIISSEHIPTINGESITVGDEIGIYTSRNRCAGMGVWVGTDLQIDVYGDDEENQDIIGFLTNEPLTFKLWDDSEQTEYSAHVNYFAGESGFSENALIIPSSIWVGLEVSIENDCGKPSDFFLYQNNPNPFNAYTSIPLYMTQSERIRIDVYTISGERIGTLVNDVLSAGYHSIQWNAGQFASGIYIYSVKSKSKTETKKMLLIR